MIGLIERPNMDSPLDILSQAAQLVRCANNGTRVIKTGVRRGRPSIVNTVARLQNRISAPVVPIPRTLDEPLDMTLKTRKRAISGDSMTSSNNSDGDPTIKKHRPSVISYGRQPERRDFSVNNNSNMESPAQPIRGNIIRPVPLSAYTNFVGHRRVLPKLVISDDYSEDGIEKHFRRSLMKYMKKSDVDITMKKTEESIVRRFDRQNFYKIEANIPGPGSDSSH